MARRAEGHGQGRMSEQRMWAELHGVLRRLVWLEQRLLCRPEAGLRKEGAQ